MSLKAFHLVFITASTALSAGLAWWCLVQYNHGHEGVYLAACAGSVLAGMGLVAYGNYFLKKIRKLVPR